MTIWNFCYSAWVSSFITKGSLGVHAGVLGLFGSKVKLNFQCLGVCLNTIYFAEIEKLLLKVL